MHHLIKLFAAFLCLISFSSISLAAEVDKMLARIVSENYLDYVVQEFDVWTGVEPTINSIESIEYQGVQIFWMVDVHPTGFLLVSSRDELSPVKLYSDQDGFDPARVDNPAAPESWIIPEQYSSVTAVVNLREQRLSQGDSFAVKKINQAWELFGKTDMTRALSESRIKTTQAGPLIRAAWGQGDPYNRQTPTVFENRTLVGCVATAWSMLLRHWQWPDQGKGIKTHTWEDQTFTVDFSKQSWDWANMPDVLTADSPEVQIDAVAKLGFQVGVAAEMNWGIGESGSDPYADEVFDVYFKYKDTMSRKHRDETSAEDWFDYYKTEFRASPARPVVMSIFGVGGGHEILADGYQEGILNKVHLNLGWDGFANAWYDVTSDFETGSYTWSADRTIIVVGIEPDYSPGRAFLPGVLMLLLEEE